jgi:glycerol kinase
MKSAIGGGGTKEDEVLECLESILCKRFARFRKSWSAAAAAVAAVALGWGGRKDLKVSAYHLCKKKKKKKKGPNSQSRNNGSRRRRKLRRWEATTQQ